MPTRFTSDARTRRSRGRPSRAPARHTEPTERRSWPSRRTRARGRAGAEVVRVGGRGLRRRRSASTSSMQDAVLLTSSPGAARGRRGLPRHRLPLRRDHRHAGRGRRVPRRADHDILRGADRRRAGRRVRPAAVRARPRPVLRAAQGGAARAGARARTTRGSPACAATRPRPAPRRRRRLGRARSGRSRSTRSPRGPHDEVDAYVEEHGVAGQPARQHGYPSIGCAPCTRAVAAGEDPRAGRWAGLCQDRVRAAHMTALRDNGVASTARRPPGRRAARARPARRPGVRGDPHHARGRRRVRAPVLLFSRRQGLDRHAAPRRKAFWPARLPFPLMHVDTGHNFPEVLAFRDETRGRARRCGSSSPSVQDSIDDGRLQRAAGRHPQPAADGDAARRDRGAPLRRRLRRRPPRRGEGPRQGARLQPARRVRPVGPAQPAARAVGPLQRPAPPGEHVRVFPLSNWTELDVWAYIEREGIELPADLLRPRARGVPRDGMWLAGRRSPPRAPARRVRDPDGALPHRRRHDLHRARSSRRPPPSPRSSPRSRPPGSPSAAPPAPTTGLRGRHGGPQAGGVLLMAPPLGVPARTATARSPALATAGSVDDGKSTLVGRLLHDAKVGAGRPAGGGRARPAATGASDGDSTWPCSPTACAPSASRASRSTSPTATSRRRAARSSSPTPPGTSSTRGTWSPAPPPPTSPSCWSTSATGCSSRAGGTPRSPRCCGVPHVVLVVNKMDLVDWDEAASRASSAQFRAFAARVGIADIRRRPGLGPARRQRRRSAPAPPPWYSGPALLEHLDAVEPARAGTGRGLRFPVQYVVRPRRRAPRLPRVRRARRRRHRARPATRSSCCRRACGPR